MDWKCINMIHFSVYSAKNDDEHLTIILCKHLIIVAHCRNLEYFYIFNREYYNNMYYVCGIK